MHLVSIVYSPTTPFSVTAEVAKELRKLLGLKWKLEMKRVQRRADPRVHEILRKYSEDRQQCMGEADDAVGDYAAFVVPQEYLELDCVDLHFRSDGEEVTVNLDRYRCLRTREILATAATPSRKLELIAALHK